MRATAKNFYTLFDIARGSDRPVIFPTDTIYGIGAPLSSVAANEKIFEIKNRPPNAPFPILASSVAQLEKIAQIEMLTPEQRKFFDEKKLSSVTFIFKARQDVAGIYQKMDTIALRIPACSWLREGLELLGEPITATSVNLSTQPPLNTFEGAFDAFGDKVGLFLKGEAGRAVNSEIYDVTGLNVIKIR